MAAGGVNPMVQLIYGLVVGCLCVGYVACVQGWAGLGCHDDVQSYVVCKAWVSGCWPSA